MIKPLHFSLLTILIIITGLSSCKKDSQPDTPPDTPPTAPKAKLSLLNGDGQSGIYGDYLPSDLSFKVTPPEGSKTEQYIVQFAMIQGNGIMGYANIYNYSFTPDTAGMIKVKWQLGCNEPKQKTRAYLYKLSATYPGNGMPAAPEDSVTIEASGTKPAGWGRSCGCGNPDMYNAQIITFDKKTLYLASRQLYSSTDGGINWSKVSGVPNTSDIVGAQFNSKGWMYVLTKNDGIFLTKDMNNWQAINNGILDHRDPTGFMVTDDLLMVSFYFDGPYLSTDNGGFWRKLLVDSFSQRYYFMKRHPNGSLYLFDDWGTLFTSKDVGKTWQKVPLGYQYFMSQPHGFEIGADGNLYIGSDDATMARLSPATLQGTAKRYYQWNSWSQQAENIQFYNNDVYFLLRSTPQPGIYSINNNWGRVEVNFNKTIYSYFIKPDGKFLLLSDDGLYYRN
jgi:hypothetical protein